MEENVDPPLTMKTTRLVHKRTLQFVECDQSDYTGGIIGGRADLQSGQSQGFTPEIPIKES